MESSAHQPTVLSAVWRHRWMVLLVVILVSALGYLYAASRPAEYVSTATLVVEDPRSRGVLETGGGNPERYVADQVAMLESAVVAARAAELAAEQIPDGSITADDILDDTDVAGGTQSSIIEVSFRAADPEHARVVTDALLAAYEELRTSQAESSSRAALERLDASLQAMNDELAAIQDEIDAAQEQSPFESRISAQAEAAITRLIELWQEQAETTSSDQLAVIQAQIDAITSQLQTIDLVRGLGQTSPELTALIEERAAVLQRRGELQVLRDQMVLDADLAPTGISVISPATPGEPSGPGFQSIMAVSVILGLLGGGGVAYLMAQRRRTFVDRAEPELVLNAPLLAEVPVFSEEGIKSALPVVSKQVSAAAEAFRFAASAIEIQGSDAKSLIAVSSTVGDGKTTIVANTGIAAAQQGARVLLVDADFGDQRLSRMLLDGYEAEQGLTDIADMGVDPNSVVRQVKVGEVELSLIGRGRLPVTAPDVFRSAGIQEFFTDARQQFDLILIDAPPLLQVAYASSVARYAGAAVVVVPHDSDMEDVEDLAARLSFIGIPVAGYVYNFAPLRPEMVPTSRSLSGMIAASSTTRTGGQGGRRHRP